MACGHELPMRRLMAPPQNETVSCHSVSCPWVSGINFQQTGTEAFLSGRETGKFHRNAQQSKKKENKDIYAR